ncbi:ComF family protein [Sporosarcina sp. G11-34]|uniref:ComF family protein n=1 Tax=Sporosarcina sp. G11-34 TaxID=2849605 RepID=UPI0022A99595|nr:phosphoribosyltransferase family protein [Sporosarcina sp. G11-34]MCZ2257268.1 ComF family protein [Sporosarcina sp. G11-34]
MNECLLCEKELSSKPSWKSLLALEEETFICLDCSKKFKHADTSNEATTLDGLVSLYTYNEAMRDYLHQFKFLQDVALADVFANELRTVLKSKVNIVPIPMHPNKKVARTFAHVEELLKSAQIPYIDILEKIDEESMGEKSKQERLAMSPLFRFKQSTVIKPETYLLIDDIYTTGTTLNHAARLLKEAGAAKVEAVTLIRAILND